MKQIFIGFLLLLPFIAVTENKFDGIYSNGNQSFEIKKDSFIIIGNNSIANGLLEKDTLAIGTAKVIDNSFIELNTIGDRYDDVINSIKIEQDKDSSLIDSVRIKFVLSDDKTPLIIEINTGSSNYYSFEYSNNNKEILLPINTKNIYSFSITPKDYATDSIGRIDSNLDFWYREKMIKIEPEINNILIYIPEINDNYFSRYYIYGEYANIKDGRMLWRGDKYIKK